MGRLNRRISTGEHQRQSLGIIAVGFDMDERGFDHACLAPFGPPAH
jgi:hypothetical protein